MEFLQQERMKGRPSGGRTMNGVESATNVEGTVRAVLGRREPGRALGAKREAARDADVIPEEGALAKARDAVRQAMARSGFISIAGEILENFKVLLEGPAHGMEVEDLKPGVLEELIAWVAAQIAAKADQATQAQAHVRSEAAIKLLT